MLIYFDYRPLRAAGAIASFAVAPGALAFRGRAPGRQISNAITGVVPSGRFTDLFAFLRLRGGAAAVVAVPLIGGSAITARGRLDGVNG